MNAGASLSAVPSPIEGSGTAWVLLGSWALSPARPTPIPPRHECRGFSALLVMVTIYLPPRVAKRLDAEWLDRKKEDRKAQKSHVVTEALEAYFKSLDE